jgi:hypothetical protein
MGSRTGAQTLPLAKLPRGRVIAREHYALIVHFVSILAPLLTRTRCPYYSAINTGKEVVG